MPLRVSNYPAVRETVCRVEVGQEGRTGAIRVGSSSLTLPGLGSRRAGDWVATFAKDKPDFGRQRYTRRRVVPFQDVGEVGGVTNAASTNL